jgi:hypothetical protein
MIIVPWFALVLWAAVYKIMHAADNQLGEDE